MIRTNWAISMAALCLLSFSSCSHDLGPTLQQVNEQEFTKNFEASIGQVNPNQDWNLYSDRSVSVQVGGEASVNYTLYVCDKNPAQDNSASLLAVATAQGGTTANIDVNLATAIETVYIVRGDGVAQYVVPASLNGNQFEGSFVYSPAASARTRAVSLASGNPFNVINTDDFYKTSVPAVAEIPSSDLLSDVTDAIYKVTSGSHTPWPYYNTVTYTLYVAGDVTLNFLYTSGQNLNIYVVSGTLTVTGDDSQNNANGFISVAPDAKLVWNRSTSSVTKYTRLINESDGKSFTIYNRGTFEIQDEKLGIVDNATIYNEGTLKAPNGIEVVGGTRVAYLYNVGENAELELGSLKVSTNGHFLNDGGTVTITGKTEAGDSNTWWVNNGPYTTGTLDILQNNQHFYNYCQLFINDKLSIVGGGSAGTEAVFHQMDGSYLEAESGLFNNVTVELGAGAGFNIKNGSYWRAKGSQFQGFKAGANQAFVRLGGKTEVESHIKNFQANGNIALGIENFVDLGNGNVGDQPLTEITNGAAEVKFDNLTVTPNAKSCGAAWTIGGGIEPTYEYNTIAFEDLGSTDDFDFNDIVLEIAKDAKTGKATATIVAAGGTLPVDVEYDGEVIFSKTDGVMHTNRGNYGNAEITLNSNEDLKKFKLIVKNEGNLQSSIIESATKKGEAPQALIIPGQWAWPTERTNITTAYPDFANWVINTTNTDWYTNPVDGTVVK